MRFFCLICRKLQYAVQTRPFTVQAIAVMGTTCAREAEAMGFSSKEAKRASGGLPRSSVIILDTSEYGDTGH